MSVRTGDGVIEGLHTEAHVLWRIPNYFSRQAADSFYDSPEFHFLGSTWIIVIYPNGLRINQSVGFVAFGVQRKIKYEKHDVSFKIGIVCDKEELREVCGTYLSSESGLIGSSKFIEKSILESKKSLVAPEGTLTIKFVGKPLQVFHAASQTKILDGVDALSQDFGTLLSNEQASDFKIRVKSRVFPAHRMILEARSTVFAAMFKHDMKERNTNSVNIEDCEATTFQDFLAFMYTGKIDNLSPENVFDIFYLANKYDRSDLKQICIDFMEENLCVNIVCHVLSLAEKFNMIALKKSAKEFFSKNKKTVMLSENWIPFIKENTNLATEILVDTL